MNLLTYYHMFALMRNGFWSCNQGGTSVKRVSFPCSTLLLLLLHPNLCLIFSRPDPLLLLHSAFRELDCVALLALDILGGILLEVSSNFKR